MEESKFDASGKENGDSNTLRRKIVYDRQFLLKCRESSYSKVAPTDLPEIQGVTIATVTPRNPQQRIVVEGQRRLALRDSHPGMFKFDGHGISQTPMKIPMREWGEAIAGGPLAQYRRRQSNESFVAEGGPMLPEDFFLAPMHRAHHHPMDSPPGNYNPVSPNAPFIPPPVLMAHPMQGPAGVVSEQNCVSGQMSKLNIWRKSHARNEIPDVQGYTTAKTPQLRPSFPPHPTVPTGNRRYSVPEFGSSPIPTPPGLTLLNPARLLAEAGYHTHHSINTGIPDDPCIVAFMTAGKMAGDSSSRMISPLSISF